MLDLLRRMLGVRIPRRGMAVYQMLFVEQRSVAYAASHLGVEHASIAAWRERIRAQLNLISIQLGLCVAAGWPGCEGGAEAA